MRRTLVLLMRYACNALRARHCLTAIFSLFSFFVFFFVWGGGGDKEYFTFIFGDPTHSCMHAHMCMYACMYMYIHHIKTHMPDIHFALQEFFFSFDHVFCFMTKKKVIQPALILGPIEELRWN